MSRIEEDLETYVTPPFCDFRPGGVFLEVPVRQQENKHIRIAPEVVDWWEAEGVDRRKQQLEKDGALVDLWWKDNKKGLLWTANGLYRLDEEQAPLLWLAAFLYDAKNNLPPEWRGDAARLLRVSTIAVRRQINGIYPWWHHAMRNVLPTCIVHLFAPPKDVHELVEMAWVTARLCLQTHQLVLVKAIERDSHDI